MGRFNDLELLALFEQDDIGNSLDQPTAVDYPKGTTVPLTTKGAFTPAVCYIHKIVIMFGDLLITNPTADRYLGWAVWSAPNGGASPTYASVVGYTANIDLPLIHENTVDSDTAVAPVVNTPFDLMEFVGGSDGTDGADGASLRADGTPTGPTATPIRVVGPWFQVKLASYLDDSLVTMSGLDDVSIWVYGRRVAA